MSAGWIITFLIALILLLAATIALMAERIVDLATDLARTANSRDMAQRDLGDALAAMRGEPDATVIQWPGGAS